MIGPAPNRMGEHPARWPVATTEFAKPSAQACHGELQDAAH